MSAISTILTRLRAAIWAIDVRDDIANAIEQCYSDVSNPTLQTEALEAALQTKIDEGEMAALTIGDGTITGAKLANGTIPKAKLDPSITFDADATFDTTSTNAIQNKVVAGAISTLQADLDAIEPGLSSDAKEALMACFAHVTWDGDSSSYMDDLRTALGIVVNPFENAEYQLGGAGFNGNTDNNTGCVAVNSTSDVRVRTTVPVSCKRGMLTAKTGYEINAYLLNSTSYGDWYTAGGVKLTGYNDVSYADVSLYQWAAQKEILTGTNYVMVIVRKTSGEAFTQGEAAGIYGTGFTYEEVSA